ncbi:hypothetical protein GBF38_020314, partial [Nibea albiflora]
SHYVEKEKTQIRKQVASCKIIRFMSKSTMS